ncbi:hypothetical protein [Mycolicibacter minnesotensis]
MSDHRPPPASVTPTGSGPVSSGPAGSGPAGSIGRIIRREPTGTFPTGTGAPPNPSGIAPASAHWPALAPSPAAAAGTCVLALTGCWATSVVATDLIAGWWHTDRLFCVAVGFLTAVFALATVAGVILLLLQRPLGRYLIALGAAVALLTFGSLLLAGARLPWIVYAIPAIAVGTVLAALHPATRRWPLGG